MERQRIRWREQEGPAEHRESSQRHDRRCRRYACSHRPRRLHRQETRPQPEGQQEEQACGPGEQRTARNPPVPGDGRFGRQIASPIQTMGIFDVRMFDECPNVVGRVVQQLVLPRRALERPSAGQVKPRLERPSLGLGDVLLPAHVDGHRRQRQREPEHRCRKRGQADGGGAGTHERWNVAMPHGRVSAHSASRRNH